MKDGSQAFMIRSTLYCLASFSIISCLPASIHSIGKRFLSLPRSLSVSVAMFCAISLSRLSPQVVLYYLRRSWCSA